MSTISNNKILVPDVCLVCGDKTFATHLIFLLEEEACTLCISCLDDILHETIKRAKKRGVVRKGSGIITYG